MDNKDNMTIEQLELLVQAYFDCELNRREEEDLKAVLLFAEAHSPLIDECRLAMGLESIAARPQAHVATVHRRFKFRKWIAAAACLTAVAVTGIVMMTTAGKLQDSSETVITVYANGKRITDSDQAHDIAMSKYNECIALAKNSRKMPICVSNTSMSYNNRLRRYTCVPHIYKHNLPLPRPLLSIV